MHAVENFVRQLADLRVLEVLAASENSAKQNGGVNRGEFGLPEALAGIDVGPMVEKSALVGQLLPEKAQRVDHAFAGERERDIAALFADAQRGQAESGGGDAADHTVVGGAHIAAVLHHSGAGIGLIPEKLKNRFFELLEEGIVSGRKVAGRRKLRGRRGSLAAGNGGLEREA